MHARMQPSNNCSLNLLPALQPAPHPIPQSQRPFFKRLQHLSISPPSETFGARSFKNSSNLRSLATYATCDLMNRFGEPSQVPNQIDTGELPTKFIQRVLSWIPWVFPYWGNKPNISEHQKNPDKQLIP